MWWLASVWLIIESAAIVKKILRSICSVRREDKLCFRLFTGGENLCIHRRCILYFFC